MCYCIRWSLDILQSIGDYGKGGGGIVQDEGSNRQDREVRVSTEGSRGK